jgi:hypothetical protein
VTSQLDKASHVILLPPPAVTPQLFVFEQLAWQLSPQTKLQSVTESHPRLQPVPQNAVQ